MSKIGKVKIGMPQDKTLISLNNIPDGGFFLYNDSLHIATEVGWVEVSTGNEADDLTPSTKVIPVNVTINVSFV